jgi:hypothetical protein
MDAIERSISPAMIKKIMAKPIIKISLEFENI